MFDVGFTELFLLGLVGLMVLGPERLPRVARTLGNLVRKARTSWFALRRTIESELAAAEMTESVKSAGKDIEEIGRSLDAIGKSPAGSKSPREKEPAKSDSAQKEPARDTAADSKPDKPGAGE
jgi:sec-independent protein translocase protein TatB